MDRNQRRTITEAPVAAENPMIPAPATASGPASGPSAKEATMTRSVTQPSIQAPATVAAT